MPQSRAGEKLKFIARWKPTGTGEINNQIGATLFRVNSAMILFQVIALALSTSKAGFD